MTVYMLLNVMALLFFTPNHPITLKFNESIEFYNIGNEGDFYLYKSKNDKLLVIKPMIQKFNVSLVVITEKHNYQFQIRNTKKSVPPLVVIDDGRIDRIYKLKNKTNHYKILEGDRSIQIVKLSEKTINVNGFKQKKHRQYYSKGSAIIINGERHF